MRDDVVTIYNKYGNDKPTRWGRHVLTGVHFVSGFGTSVSTSGVSGGLRECKLLIPLNNRYCSPEAYQNADNKSQLWTLQSGDAIMEGVGPEGEITGNIKTTVPGCKLITGMVAHIHGSRLDHWSVIAK